MRIGHMLCEAALAAMIALLASTGAARAEEPAEPAETTAAEGQPASKGAEPGDAIPSVRFADRRQVLFRIGFGGTYKDATFGDPKAKPSLGATLRWERPVHEYVTTGLDLTFYGAKPEFLSRQPAIEVSLMLKGRYPFTMGRKERKFESEVYLLVQVGALIWIDSNALDFNLIGPGFAVGAAPGYLFFINKRVGLLVEVGWSYAEALFARGRGSVSLHQGVMRLGAVFPF